MSRNGVRTSAPRRRYGSSSVCMLRPSPRRTATGSRLFGWQLQYQLEGVINVNRLALQHRRLVSASLQSLDHRSVHEGFALDHPAVVNHPLHCDDALDDHQPFNLMVPRLGGVLWVRSRKLLRPAHGVVEFHRTFGLLTAHHSADDSSDHSTDHASDDAAFDTALDAGIFLLRLCLGRFLLRHLLGLNDLIRRSLRDRLVLHRLCFWWSWRRGRRRGWRRLHELDVDFVPHRFRWPLRKVDGKGERRGMGKYGHHEAGAPTALAVLSGMNYGVKHQSSLIETFRCRGFCAGTAVSARRVLLNWVDAWARKTIIMSRRAIYS